jgi:hypothetical protein
MAIFKKRGEYWIDYYVGGRRRREKIGPSKKLAAAVLAKRKVQIAENRYLDIDSMPQLSFDNLADMYLEYAKTNHRCWKRHALVRITALRNYFRGKPLIDITPASVELYNCSALRIARIRQLTMN